MESIALKFLLLVVLPGIGGGFIFAAHKGSSYQLVMPGGRIRNLGFVGNLLLGLGGSVAVFAFREPTLQVDSFDKLLVVAAISLVAGYASTSLLPNIASKLSEVLLTNVSHSLDISPLLERAKQYESTDPRIAVLLYSIAFEIDANDKRAVEGLRRLLTVFAQLAGKPAGFGHKSLVR